jgi:hypothetical protein
MHDVKGFLQSRTVWANAVGLLAMAAAWAGVDIGSDDLNSLTEACLQAVTALCIIASTVFRVIATRRIAA